MAEIIKYTCSCCGKEHEEWPALVYKSPTSYNSLSDNEKRNIGKLDSDFCVITYPDQTDRFIRCTLTQLVIDHCDHLEYGLWVSLSHKSFQDYLNNFNNETYESKCFGWLSNNLPEYDFIESVPMTVFIRPGNERPEIVPYESFDHLFIKDYYHGITKIEAERRVKGMLKMINKRDKEQIKTKPWWKL